MVNFPSFSRPIQVCRNKTLGNNIHSSQYHRSFCKQVLGLKCCHLWCPQGVLLCSKLVVCKGITKPKQVLVHWSFTNPSKTDQQTGMKQYKRKSEMIRTSRRITKNIGFKATKIITSFQDRNSKSVWIANWVTTKSSKVFFFSPLTDLVALSRQYLS